MSGASRVRLFWNQWIWCVLSGIRSHIPGCSSVRARARPGMPGPWSFYIFVSATVAPAVLPVRNHDICDIRYQDICDIFGVGFSAESRGNHALEEGGCAGSADRVRGARG